MKKEFVLMFTFALYVNGQRICKRPDGKNGVCVDYIHCPEIVEKIKSINKPNLTAYTCGFNGNIPQVCCDDCFTPDGNPGKCVHVNSCPHLLAMSKTRNLYDQAFVRSSRCETGNRDVCCGPPPAQNRSIDDCKTGVTAFPPETFTQCCGYDVKTDSKIVGGDATGIDEYPWAALLEYEVRDDTGKVVIKTYCGGSLISNRYVLTAAHCIKGGGAWPPVNVRLGEYDIRTEIDCVEGDCNWANQVIPIEEITIHPEYNPDVDQGPNDIALIRLARPANITDFVRPICLPIVDVSLKDPSPEVVAAGWGKVNGTHRSAIKQHVALPLLKTQECQNTYKARMGVFSPTITRKQLCAGGEEGKDACKGDSGGPLMLKTGVLHELVGVVSYGTKSCGIKGLPGIYTNVFPYSIWIRRSIRP